MKKSLFLILVLSITGLHLKAQQLDVVGTANQNGLTTTDDGKVGVGIKTPGAKFMVKGESGVPVMNIVTSAGTVPALRVNDDEKVGIGTATPGAKLMVVGQAGSPTLNVLSPMDGATDPSLRVNEDRNVGVGTSTPGAKFMVKGTGPNPTLNVVTSMGTVPALRVNDDENVGLGTGAPKTKLHVASGDVYLDDAMNGVILTSPMGNCYRVTVADDGTLISTSITCP